MSICVRALRVTHLRGWKRNKDWIRIRLGLGALPGLQVASPLVGT